MDALARTDPGFNPHRPEPDGVPTPTTLARFSRSGAPPTILFPPEGAELWAEAAGRSFVLSARGQGVLRWYADGRPADQDAGGAPIFAPHGPGFYELAVVDEAGRSARTRVRVRMPASAS